MGTKRLSDSDRGDKGDAAMVEGVLAKTLPLPLPVLGLPMGDEPKKTVAFGGR